MGLARRALVHDGTAGHALFKAIYPTGSAFPEHLLVVGDTLYFGPRFGTNYQIWKSDGAPRDRPITTFPPPVDPQPHFLQRFDHFRATRLHFIDLWARSIHRASILQLSPKPVPFATSNGILFLAHRQPQTAPSWKPMAADALYLKDIAPVSSSPTQLTISWPAPLQRVDGSSGQKLAIRWHELGIKS